LSAQEKAQQEAIVKALPKDLRKVFRYSALFENMERGETMAMLPFELEIK